MSKDEFRDYRPKIIDFQKSISGVKIASMKSMLWPFHVFKVSLPAYRKRELNIFEETILRLSLGGMCTTKELSETTCLAIEIVEFIQNRLNNLTLLTERNEPTENAKKLLQSYETEPTEYTSGTVFVDLLSGRVMPIIMNGLLEYENLKEVKGDYVEFKRGSTGDSKTINAFKINPKAEYFSLKPTPVEVIRAAKEHRILHKRYSSLNNSAVEMPAYSNLADAITIANSGELVFLHCRLLIQKGSEDFIVSDPFGYGISPFMTRDFKILIKTNKGAYSLTGYLKERAQNIDLNKEVLNDSNNKEFIEFNAYPEIRSKLRTSKRSYNKVKKVVQSSADEKERQKAINDMADSFYSCFEWALRQIVFDYPAEEWENIFTTLSYKENENVLRDLSEKCGFVIPRKSAILQVKPGKIKALYSNQVEMQPLLALAIAGASQNPLHPINNVARYDSNWLGFVNDLKKQRDFVFHGENASIENLERIWKRFMLSISYLFPQIKFTEENFSVNSEHSEDYSNERINSRVSLDRYFGIDKVIEMPENIREQLMNIQMFMDTQKENMEQKIDCRKVVMELANALQGSLFRVLNSKKTEAVPIKEPKEYARSRAMEAGFNLSDRAFPISIATVNKRRLVLTCEGKDVTLGANLLGLLILVDDNILKKVAEDLPDLINFVGKIAELRGHGNLSIFLSIEKLSTLKEQVFYLVKYFMEAEYE